MFGQFFFLPLSADRLAEHSSFLINRTYVLIDDWLLWLFCLFFGVRLIGLLAENVVILCWRCDDLYLGVVVCELWLTKFGAV